MSFFVSEIDGHSFVADINISVASHPLKRQFLIALDLLP